MTRETSDAGRIATEASEWAVRRDRGLSAAEVATFSAWLQADPRHEEAFARMDATWRGLDRLPENSQLVALADAVLHRRQRERRRRGMRWWGATTLAAAAAVAVLFFTARQPHADRDGASGVARSVRVIESTLVEQTLSDGTRVQRNGASQVESAFTPTQRAVTLVSGEAHFVVAKDTARPFVVSADVLTVQAVGTAFNVRLTADRVEVLVTEGTVKLGPQTAGGAAEQDALTLVGGQRVVVARRKPLELPAASVVSGAEVEEYLAWRGPRLVFDDTPLNEVVAAFNRYNSRMLVIGDPRLESRRLTGVFRAENLDAFVRLLHASVDVRGEARGEREVVLWPAQ